MPHIVPTNLENVLVIEPDVHLDVRGFFMETYHAVKYAAAGITAPFVQDNHSRSAAGTLRGIHLQVDPPQAKLVRVVRGTVMDVAVDLRLDSPNFGRWVSVELSEYNFRQMYIPAGFGHAFYVTDGPAEVEYKTTAPYNRAGELGVIWDDPDLAIAWPASKPMLSDRDRSLPRLTALRQQLLTQSRA